VHILLQSHSAKQKLQSLRREHITLFAVTTSRGKRDIKIYFTLSATHEVHNYNRTRSSFYTGNSKIVQNFGCLFELEFYFVTVIVQDTHKILKICIQSKLKIVIKKSNF